MCVWCGTVCSLWICKYTETVCRSYFNFRPIWVDPGLTATPDQLSDPAACHRYLHTCTSINKSRAGQWAESNNDLTVFSSAEGCSRSSHVQPALTIYSFTACCSERSGQWNVKEGQGETWEWKERWEKCSGSGELVIQELVWDISKLIHFCRWEVTHQRLWENRSELC